VIAVSPLIAAGFTATLHAITGSSTVHIGNIDYRGVGYNFVLLLAAAIAVWLGIVSYKEMDDRRGVPLRDDLIAVVRGEPSAPARHPRPAGAAPAARPGGAAAAAC